jgi:thymidylate kinase
MDTMLEGQIQAVVLEGEEGIGKTTLAAQFVESHPNRAFCLFAVGPRSLTA